MSEKRRVTDQVDLDNNQAFILSQIGEKVDKKEFIRQISEVRTEVSKLEDKIEGVGSALSRDIQNLSDNIHKSQLGKSDIWWKILGVMFPFLAMAGVLIVQTINGAVSPTVATQNAHLSNTEIHQSGAEKAKALVPRNEFESRFRLHEDNVESTDTELRNDIHALEEIVRIFQLNNKSKDAEQQALIEHHVH